jgi:hypothetical protein
VISGFHIINFQRITTISSNWHFPLPNASAGLVQKMGMIALLLLCGAVCCSVYFLATIIKSRPTGNRSPAPALGGITESRSAENKISEPARRMLNDLLEYFDSTSFGFPPVDPFNVDGLGYRPTYPRTDCHESQTLISSLLDPF